MGSGVGAMRNTTPFFFLIFNPFTVKVTWSNLELHCVLLFVDGDGWVSKAALHKGSALLLHLLSLM